MSKDKTLIALDKASAKEYPFGIEEGEKYTFDGKQLDVDIQTTPDGFSIMTVNGVSYPVEIVSHHQNEYELLVNGVGYIFSVETPFSLQRQKMLSSEASESTTIRLKAPMPGKILG